MNILIRASRERTAHKMREYMGDGFCWWTVNGTPRQTKEGDIIMFSDGDRVYAEAEILGVEEGQIEFYPLDRVDKPNPKKPPTRGFTYV